MKNHKQIIIIASLGLLFGFFALLNNKYWSDLTKQTGYDVTLTQSDKEFISKNKPILSGSKQNTPTIKTDTILSSEDQLNTLLQSHDVAVIFFKVGCPVCQPLYQTEKKYTESNKYFVYVNVNSKLGRILTKEHNIKTAYSVTTFTQSQSHYGSTTETYTLKTPSDVTKTFTSIIESWK